MGIKNTLKKNMDPEVFAASMSRLGVSIQTTFNPNHRHDEKWEQENDRMRQEICESHRYKSFARVRENNAVKWYSDGHDYFWALSEILEGAQECIFVSNLSKRSEDVADLDEMYRSWIGGYHQSFIFVVHHITLRNIESIDYSREKQRKVCKFVL